MKLEVGMYVRTNDGYIFKIKELLEKGKYNDSDNKIVHRFRINGMYQKNEDYIETDYMYSDWIKKASHNIIDLIEVGDYVNGHLVCDSSDGRVIMAFTDDLNEMNSIKDEFKQQDLIVFKVYKLEDMKDEINLIITKEQFSQMAYKVGD